MTSLINKSMRRWLERYPLWSSLEYNMYLLNPPATGKYDAIKKWYVREDDESNYQCLLNITQDNLLPSEHLQEMQHLNHRRTGEIPNRVIRSMYLSKLPAQVQPLLDAVGSEESDDDYSVLAYKIYKRRQQEQSSC